MDGQMDKQAQTNTSPQILQSWGHKKIKVLSAAILLGSLRIKANFPISKMSTI